MTCIKTGARALIVPYGYVVACDIYRVSNAIIIRCTRDMGECITSMDQNDADWEIYDHTGSFWRPDIGMIVIDQAFAEEKLPKG